LITVRICDIGLLNETCGIHGLKNSGGLMDTTAGKAIEGFVDANRTAEFLSLPRRRVLELSRQGRIPAHPIGDGRRKQWRYRLSEVAEAFTSKRDRKLINKVIIEPGSPWQPNRRI
jgi:hypothetical protein